MKPFSARVLRFIFTTAGKCPDSFIYMIPFFLFLSNIKKAIPHKIICTKVEYGVASPILKSVGFAVRLIKYETGIRTPNAPMIP